MTSEITISVGFEKSDGTRFSLNGVEPRVLLRCSDLKGITQDEFDLVIDRMADDGAVVKVE